MSILVSAFHMHSFLSIPGTILAPNQEWHHSAGIFVPQNVILAGLWAKIDSSGFCRIPQEWPESSRNQWGMIKTSFNKPPTCVLCDIGICEEHIKLSVFVQVLFTTQLLIPDQSTTPSCQCWSSSPAYGFNPSSYHCFYPGSPCSQLVWRCCLHTIIPIFTKNQPHHDLSAKHD